MNIKKTNTGRELKLQEICEESDINFATVRELLDSIRARKLWKRNSYVQQKINDIIESSLK